jgi:phage-related protein
VAAGINVIVQFLNGVASKLPAIINSAFTVIISFINGLADAIRNNNPAIFAAIGNLLGAIVGAIVGFIPNMVGVGARLIQGFINGIFNMGGSASGASKSVASNAVSGASGYNETFYSIGSYMMQGMVNGIKSMAGNLLNSARSVVSGAVSSVKSFLGIHSPSRVFAEIGMFSALGMANGLRDFGGTVVKEAKNVGINAVDTMGNAISNISDVVNSNMDTNPTIRPVLDLSDVQNGSKRLSSLMDKNGIYTLNSSVGLANVASSGMSYNKVSSIDSPSTNDVVQPINQTQQNTFNITGSNPKEIADEVSRILQKQVERSETVWA